MPYGEVWRAGANENTTITFGDPVTIEGQPLTKGTYGLHMIPGENEWTVVFSKVHSAWVTIPMTARKIRPQPAEMCEALLYLFDDVKPDSAVARLR